MSNLLLDDDIKAKLTELLGSTPSDLWLDIAWEILNEIVGYKMDLQEREEINIGLQNKKSYLNARPVIEILEVKLNGNIQDLASFSIYKERALLNINSCFRGGVNPCSLEGLAPLMYADTIFIKYNAGYTAETFPSMLIWVSSLIIEYAQDKLKDEGKLSNYKISDIGYGFINTHERRAEIAIVLDPYIPVVI